MLWNSLYPEKSDGSEELRRFLLSPVGDGGIFLLLGDWVWGFSSEKGLGYRWKQRHCMEKGAEKKRFIYHKIKGGFVVKAEVGNWIGENIEFLQIQLLLTHGTWKSQVWEILYTISDTLMR